MLKEQRNSLELQNFFRAVGDNTRRIVLDLLAENGQMTVSQLSEQFPHLVRSGISKHLMDLRKSNIVFATKRGREQYYQINPEMIRNVLKPWVEKYEKYWDERLMKLKRTAESMERDANESTEEDYR